MNFFELVRVGSPEEIALAITAGAKINARDKEQFTPLMCAARGNPNPEAIKVLLKNGADVNDRIPKYDFSPTPLTLAASENQNPEVLKTLIQAGANPNPPGGNTPLELAARYNRNPEVIKVLIESGADVNGVGTSGVAMVSDTTPLMIAAWFNPNPDVITTLIRAGANPSYKNSRGNTPLGLAASENQNPEVITALIASGDNVSNKENINDALWAAVSTNPNIEVINALIEAGAEVNQKTPYTHMDSSTKELLMSGSCKIENFKDITGGGVTPLMAAAGRQLYVRGGWENNNHEVIKLLIHAGSKVNEKDGAGMTALMEAAGRDPNPEVTRALLEAGAEINSKNDNDLTALMCALLWNYNPEVAMLLIQTGAEVNTKAGPSFNGQTPLTIALSKKPSDFNGKNITALDEIIKALIDAGADVNMESPYYHVTPLMLAAENSTTQEIIQMLLEAGANPRIRDTDNKTAFDYAKKNKNIKKTAILERLRSICQ